MRETECSHYEPADGDCLTNACGGCCVKYRAELEALRAENERLRADLEQTRVQLAGCGVIAMCNTENSLREQMPAPSAYGYSVSLADVERAVRREIALRAAAREALAALTRLADSAYQWAGRDVPPGLVSEVDAAKARLAGVLS